MFNRFGLRQGWCRGGLALCAFVCCSTQASALLQFTSVNHDYKLTVQNPFGQKFEDDTTSGFGTYMHTETLVGAGQVSTGQQDVTITPTTFSADLTSTVQASGAISATTAELRFNLSEAANVSFSGSAGGGGFNIALFNRSPRDLLLFADGAAGSDWSGVGPLTLQPGAYEFKAIASVSNGLTGTSVNSVVATFSSAGADMAGDFDGSGAVDAGDYNLWTQQFGDTGTLQADGNGDLVVDAADFAIWRDNLESAAFLHAGTPVPEPCSACIAILGMLSVRSLRNFF